MVVCVTVGVVDGPAESWFDAHVVFAPPPAHAARVAHPATAQPAGRSSALPARARTAATCLNTTTGTTGALPTQIA